MVCGSLNCMTKTLINLESLTGSTEILVTAFEKRSLYHYLLSSVFFRVLDPSWHLPSGTHLAPDPMSLCSLPDPIAASHLQDLTDLHDLACTICPLDHMVQMYHLLFMGLHYPPTDTQVCPCLDQWEESLGLAPPMDMHSTPGQALAMSLILGVHHLHTSVPLHLISLGRCRRHTVC